jgi:hypothetical protein
MMASAMAVTSILSAVRSLESGRRTCVNLVNLENIAALAKWSKGYAAVQLGGPNGASADPALSAYNRTSGT